MIASEIYMAKTPFEPLQHPQRLPSSASASSTCASDGMERARALARRYLPDAARLLAGLHRAGQRSGPAYQDALRQRIVAIAGATPKQHRPRRHMMGL